MIRARLPRERIGPRVGAARGDHFFERDRVRSLCAQLLEDCRDARPRDAVDERKGDRVLKVHVRPPDRGKTSGAGAPGAARGSSVPDPCVLYYTARCPCRSTHGLTRLVETYKIRPENASFSSPCPAHSRVHLLLPWRVKVL